CRPRGCSRRPAACRLSTTVPTARLSIQPVCSFAFSIQFTKGFALRRGHVAPVGPAAGERKIMNEPRAAAHPFEDARAKARRGRIERRAQREPAPHVESEALAPWAQPARDLFFAQLAH